ncbi:MAG: VIT domain-containing protein [Pseudomonadota bacterium]|nr:VIT domain-containing protein [Pseudomonadota bacterium]
MYLPEQSVDYSLHTTTGTNMVLQSVNVDVVLQNLLCKTTMQQLYRNLEEKPIEAVYSFPLASQAVLLELRVTIGDRKLQGIVTEKGSAEERYEEAVSDGNTAIMLEKLENGLYTMNVGNILAGEEVSIAITYAELHLWQGDTLRFHLPTTIAPRYGDPEAAGIQPHQIPEYDLLTENRFSLKMDICGLLANANIECPSHNVAIARHDDRTVLTLAAGKTWMDRDFILNLRTDAVTKDTAVSDCDINGGFVALASFTPRLPRPHKTPPKKH